MRNALVIEWNGLILHGTSHVGSGPVSRGILFFNSGSLPRSSRGDLSAQLADALAHQGFACFRVDLPGLGDSQGELPGQYLELYRYIQQGGYAQCGADLTRLLLDQYRLSEMTLLGICGGALTCIFTAAQFDHKSVPRLVLLDLPFLLYEGTSAADTQQRAQPSLYGKALRQAKSWQAAIHDWILERSWEPYVTAAYRSMRSLAATAVPKRRLPANANLKTLGMLSHLLEAGRSALLVTAQPLTPTPPGFDYIAHLKKRNYQGLQHIKIYGTTHSFVENGGREAVLDAVGKWLSSSFAPGEEPLHQSRTKESIKA